MELSKIFTKCIDTENLLISFFDLKTFFIYRQISRQHYLFLSQHSVFKLVLEFKKNHKNKTVIFMDWAAKHGYVVILDLLKKSKLGFSYSWAMDYASNNGHVDVLEWFYNNGMTVDKWDIFGNAAKKNYLHIFHWISQKEIRYEHIYYAIYKASKHGHLDVLNWLKKYSVEKNIVFSITLKNGRRMNPIHSAAEHGQVCVLDWLKNNISNVQYDEYAVDYASRNGHVYVLDWLLNSGWEFKYSANAIHHASHTKVLKWWDNYYQKTTIS